MYIFYFNIHIVNFLISELMKFHHLIHIICTSSLKNKIMNIYESVNYMNIYESVNYMNIYEGVNYMNYFNRLYQ